MKFRHQESQVGVTVAWILAPLFFTLVTFYASTIWATPSDVDLQLIDIQKAVVPALIGFAVGVTVAIAVTILYPPYIEREYRAEAEHSHHH